MYQLDARHIQVMEDYVVNRGDVAFVLAYLLEKLHVREPGDEKNELNQLLLEIAGKHRGSLRRDFSIPREDRVWALEDASELMTTLEEALVDGINVGNAPFLYVPQALHHNPAGDLTVSDDELAAASRDTLTHSLERRSSVFTRRVLVRYYPSLYLLTTICQCAH